MTLGRIARIAFVISLATFVFAFVASSGGHPSATPHPSSGSPFCKPVGGMIMTNFGAISSSTTMGTATGDLRGAVSGTLLGPAQTGPGGTAIFHVQHHWVTESGDLLFFDPATATTMPLGSGLFAILTYPVHVTGGTGKYEGATGDITNIGEVRLPNLPDVTGGTTVFRYSGEVCFASPGKE